MKTLQLLLVAAVGVILVSSKAVQNEGKRLIKVSEHLPGQWMTEDEILQLIRQKVTFIDITDFGDSHVSPDNVDVHGKSKSPDTPVLTHTIDILHI